MEISYLGHSCFKIKTKTGTVITDPYGAMTGFKMPAVSADAVIISHAHEDHNNNAGVTGTSRRKEPFIISEAGEYEIDGISIFGFQTYHDSSEGKERGKNLICVIQAEDLRILHLGDLGHVLSDKLIEDLDGIDVVMIPVGGFYTINAETAVKVIESIEPSYVLPMHYKTKAHDEKAFGELTDLTKFTESYGHTVKSVKTLLLSKLSLPQDTTEVITFETFE